MTTAKRWPQTCPRARARRRNRQPRSWRSSSRRPVCRTRRGLRPPPPGSSGPRPSSHVWFSRPPCASPCASMRLQVHASARLAGVAANAMPAFTHKLAPLPRCSRGQTRTTSARCWYSVCRAGASGRSRQCSSFWRRVSATCCLPASTVIRTRCLRCHRSPKHCTFSCRTMAGLSCLQRWPFVASSR